VFAHTRLFTREPRLFGLLGWWDGGRTRKKMSMDTSEDIAVLGALLVLSSLSLAVIVMIY
jgi:hypothetical protein